MHCHLHQQAYGTTFCKAMLQHGPVFGTIRTLGKGGAAPCMQLRCLWDLLGPVAVLLLLR